MSKKVKCNCKNPRPYQIGLTVYCGHSIEWWNCSEYKSTFIDTREKLPDDEEWSLRDKKEVVIHE